MTGVSYQRPLGPGAPGLALPPAEQAAAAALAAIETSARLGRRPVLQVHAHGITASLAEWPGSVRRQNGPRARQAISGLLGQRHRASEHRGAEWLTVSLETAPGAALGPDPRGPRLAAVARDGLLTVTVICPPGDPWWRARAAVAETFAEILAATLEHPQQPIAQAHGLSLASEQRVIRLAGHAASYGPFVPVPALVEWQADRHPNRPAIIFRDTALSYARLDQLANGLARTLAGRGVRKGQLVPVLIGNSPELPIAWLALMKLGAPFVPLDPAWPQERLGTVLDLLAPCVVLHRAATPPPPAARPLALPVDAASIRPSIGRQGTALDPADLIYGIFTSGSTGTPKCALNTHAGLANRLAFMTRYFAATGDEVVLQNSRHTFDSAFWQLFWPLTTGARCVIPAQGDFLNLEHTIDTVGAYSITITDFVPSIFNVLVALADGDASARAKLSSLRHLVVGGEEINPPMAHRLMTMLPGVTITNGYGPTETSIGVVFHRVTAGDGDTIPVGRPISNAYALIVDSSLNLLPPGATGEIAIGGVCVGAGYHRDPDGTARAFPANPVPAIPGDRLYLTGDLGYFDEHGRLCLTGRKDSQVKIGGVRIELGEIEVAAQNCPGVRHATVLSGRLASRKVLALFAAGQDGLTEAALRRRLLRALPRTSVPRYILVLREMPLTDNGKVDRRALRGLLDRKLASDAARLGPAQPGGLAGQVLSALRTVLGHPDLTPATPFPEAGGDSIHAVHAAAVLTSVCGVPVGVADVLDCPTAAALTSRIEQRRAAGGQLEPAAALMERDAVPPASAAAVPGPSRPGLVPATVLVTGGTGFVGSRLVHELLSTTGLRVVALVQAADDTRARARLSGGLAWRGLWRPEFSRRLVVYGADLSKPGLGLPESRWQDLAVRCDLVLHCGALVNFLYDYRAHRAVNVAGTAELLRLAADGQAKPFLQVSTLGALSGAIAGGAGRRGPGLLPEDTGAGALPAPDGGYSQSKWVAERYLQAARERGAVITIVRPGEVMPAADNGWPNPRALTHLLLAAFARLGCVPDVPIRSDYTPVDYLARRVVAALLDPAAQGADLNVFRPGSVDFTALLPQAGRPVQAVPAAEFVLRINDAARRSGDPGLATLQALLPPAAGAGGGAGRLLRDQLAGLLTDNPRWYGRSRCRALEQRHGLDDGGAGPAPLGAYLAWLPAGDGDADAAAGPQARNR